MTPDYYYYHSQPPMSLPPPITPLHTDPIPPTKSWIHQAHPNEHSRPGSYYHHYEEYV
jgi:hypothetical protein